MRKNIQYDKMKVQEQVEREGYNKSLKDPYNKVLKEDKTKKIPYEEENLLCEYFLPTW